MPVIAVPKVLREKLGEDGVDSLIELFNKQEEKTKEDVIVLVEEKFERRLSSLISGIREDIAILEGKLEGRINGVRQEITALEGRLNERITQEISGVRQEITALEGRINERITGEISKLNERITEEVSKFDNKMTKEISKLDHKITEEVSKLRVEMSQFKTEIIKWMFLFWIGQLACVAGIVHWLK